MGVIALTASQSLGQEATPDSLQQRASADRDSAVIFMYHRFGESEYPSTNTTRDQFNIHLDAIERGGHPVLSLPDLLDIYAAGTVVPDRAIVLTVDDAYRSVYDVAWPLLRENGHTFTLFVATDAVDRGTDAYMTWDMIRELHENGVTIGSQTASHLHMATSSASRNQRDLEKSQARFQAELGFTPDIIAYPYGEYSPDVQQMVQDMGFRAALGQHSGVSHANEDRYAMPRFALNENFGTASIFTQRANALALPMNDLIPMNPVVRHNNPPAIGFTVGERVENPERLTCYLGQQLDILWLGERRAEIRLDEQLRVGRTRINCTIQSAQGRWRWNSLMFLTPRS